MIQDIGGVLNQAAGRQGDVTPRDIFDEIPALAPQRLRRGSYAASPRRILCARAAVVGLDGGVPWPPDPAIARLPDRMRAIIVV